MSQRTDGENISRETCAAWKEKRQKTKQKTVRTGPYVPIIVRTEEKYEWQGEEEAEVHVFLHKPRRLANRRSVRTIN
jgi:hypothetical protein